MTIETNEEMPVFKLGDWCVYTDDGYWGSTTVIFKSKKDAIDDVSASTLDPRRVPKVTRIEKGFYEYIPRDVDSNGWGNSYYIKKVTKDNIEQINEEWKQQWEDDDF